MELPFNSQQYAKDVCCTASRLDKFQLRWCVRRSETFLKPHDVEQNSVELMKRTDFVDFCFPCFPVMRSFFIIASYPTPAPRKVGPLQGTIPIKQTTKRRRKRQFPQKFPQLSSCD